LEDGAIQAVKEYAVDNYLSLGKAASELIRRGVRYQIPIGERNGFPVFEVPDGFSTITSERVQQLLNEE
jgi:hypothetical protein